MRTRSNLGIVGPVQTITSSTTGIVASSADQLLAKKAGGWVGSPGAPTSVTAVPSNGSAAISFVAPASTGGAAITSYTVTSSPGNITATGSSSPITISGLTNGTSYTFTVVATNSFGSGPSSSPSSAVTPYSTVSVTYLMTAAGGGGGYYGGGGGAGGVVYAADQSLPQSYTITVTLGSGGSGGTYSPYTAATQGGNTSISATVLSTVTAYGGGRAGGSGVPGGNGGSGGGGASGDGTNTSQAKGIGVYPGSTYISATRQGYDGGTGQAGNADYAAGGGGAGAVGAGDGGVTQGNGGAGTGAYSEILQAVSAGVNSGGTYYIAGGGGGGGWLGSGAGGVGGGGSWATATGNAGTVNTGGGGGGCRYTGQGGVAGGAGGSGIVIFRMLLAVSAASTTGSPTVVTDGTYRYYKFTQSGTITF